MNWLAHSFLAVTPVRSGARKVTPLQGFSWGFSISSRQISLASAAPLTPADWVAHLSYLRATYRGWRFDSAPAWM
jgi:hypothetical protein